MAPAVYLHFSSEGDGRGLKRVANWHGDPMVRRGVLGSVKGVPVRRSECKLERRESMPRSG